MRFLEAALDSFHDEHEEVLAWYGKPFDPDDIDERYVRMALTTIANRRRGALDAPSRERVAPSHVSRRSVRRP